MKTTLFSFGKVVPLKKKNGFTLLEVIVSVAALSLLSVFILQMFMASARLNERAKNTDIAMTKAITEIERIKSATAIETLPAVHTLYFNNQWHPVSSAQRQEASFRLTLTLAGEGLGLYNVTAEVRDIRANEDNRLLTSLQTKKYFPVAAS
jgi:prepilin-type N-terminal cleavage/methylation domain-containing protein